MGCCALFFRIIGFLSETILNLENSLFLLAREGSVGGSSGATLSPNSLSQIELYGLTEEIFFLPSCDLTVRAFVLIA